MSEEKKQKSDEIKEFGALMLNENKKNYKIRLLTIIGEIEGHETVSNNTKATKYEHLLPQLAEAEESDEVEGVLILLNTLGGDVEAGLAIAEMIASLGKPTVSLVPVSYTHLYVELKSQVHNIDLITLYSCSVN